MKTQTIASSLLTVIIAVAAIAGVPAAVADTSEHWELTAKPGDSGDWIVLGLHMDPNAKHLRYTGDGERLYEMPERPAERLALMKRSTRLYLPTWHADGSATVKSTDLARIFRAGHKCVAKVEWFVDGKSQGMIVPKIDVGGTVQALVDGRLVVAKPHRHSNLYVVKPLSPHSSFATEL